MSDPLWINAGIGTLVGNATIEADDETLTIASHGLNDGDAVFVDTLTGGAVGVLFEDTVYFVRDATTNTFTLAGAEGGNVKMFTSDGTANVYTAVPRYAANELRRAQAMFLTPESSTARFGSREGVRPHSLPQVSVAGTTWTVHDLVAVVDPRTTSATGPYIVQHLEESGAIDPADATNDRIDALDLQIQDDDEDASGFRRARVVYVAGTPGVTPSPPALTTASLRLATILVPANGTPAPSIDTLGRFTVASGGIVPVRDATELNSSARYAGMAAYRQDNDTLVIWDGNAWQIMAAVHVPEVVTFTSNGSFVKANYPWGRYVVVEVVGGGGGGGGAEASDGSTTGSAAGGGGGGGYARKTIAFADLAGSETVTVGVGGAGGTAGNNNGSDGGTSSFGSHCSATGGSGGAGSAASAVSNFAIGGAGGSGLGGDVNAEGGDGTKGMRNLGEVFAVGEGGGSYLAGTRRPTAGTQGGSGLAGHAPGGGGSGGWNRPNSGGQANRTGGGGADGVVIVTVY